MRQKIGNFSANNDEEPLYLYPPAMRPDSGFKIFRSRDQSLVAGMIGLVFEVALASSR